MAPSWSDAYLVSFVFNSEPFNLGAIRPSIFVVLVGDAFISRVAFGVSVSIPTWEKATPEIIRVPKRIIFFSFFILLIIEIF